MNSSNSLYYELDNVLHLWFLPQTTRKSIHASGGASTQRAIVVNRVSSAEYIGRPSSVCLSLDEFLDPLLSHAVSMDQWQYHKSSKWNKYHIQVMTFLTEVFFLILLLDLTLLHRIFRTFGLFSIVDSNTFLYFSIIWLLRNEHKLKIMKFWGALGFLVPSMLPFLVKSHYSWKNFTK